MTTDTDKLVESFADAFFEHLKHGDAAHKQWLREETDKFFAAHAPAFRDRIIASLCGDVEPVAFMFQHSETGRVTFVDAWQKENGWATANPRYSEVGALHGASTVATLKAERDAALARVAELEQGAQPGAAKSLNAMAADLLRPYLKPGQKVIWRESFRWHDDNGVLSNHYDGMELEQLSDAFGYDCRYDMNLKHAAIVWDKAAAPQPLKAEQAKDAAEDAELLDWLEAMTDKGYCPAVVFDDDGHWAVLFDGIQSTPGDGPLTSSFIAGTETAWHDSIRAAIRAAIAAERKAP